MTAPSVLDLGQKPLAGFALATIARGAGSAPALVLDGDVVDLRSAAAAAGIDLVADNPHFGVLELLETWPQSFDALQRVAEFVTSVGIGDDRLHPHRAGARVLPPVPRPSKMVYSAQNYPDHVEEMRKARKFGFNDVDVDQDRDFKGTREGGARPYMFLKAPSCLTGPYDDVVLPPEVDQMDWEVELAVVLGRSATRVSADRAMEHVAGFMTTNDFSARNLLFRPDRERLRSDWFGGKSHDGFAPMGPVLVPAAFVADHLDLRLRLSVNGETRQDGNTGHLIFNPAEQIEFASRHTTLVPGDILATGTPGGVGQGTNSFLAIGDVVEAEVQGLGVLRNRIVAPPAWMTRGNETA